MARTYKHIKQAKAKNDWWGVYKYRQHGHLRNWYKACIVDTKLAMKHLLELDLQQQLKDLNEAA